MCGPWIVFADNQSRGNGGLHRGGGAPSDLERALFASYCNDSRNLTDRYSNRKHSFQAKKPKTERNLNTRLDACIH